MGGIRPPPTNSPTVQTPSGCPIIQFWHYLELEQIPQVKRSVPPDCPPTTPSSESSCQSHDVICTSDQMVVNQRFPHPHPVYNGLQNSGKHFTYIYWSIINKLQKIHKKRYIEWSLEGSGTSVPVELVCTTLLACGYAHQPRSSSNSAA